MMAANLPRPAHRPAGSRPFYVTMVAIVVLTITTIYLIRFVQALSWWDFLASLPGVSPLYLVLTGLLWTLIGLPLTWGLWQGWPKALKATRLFAPGFAAYVWLERLAAANAAASTAAIAGANPAASAAEFAVGEISNWPFSAGMTLLVLAAVLWALSRPPVKAYFGELHE